MSKVCCPACQEMMEAINCALLPILPCCLNKIVGDFLTHQRVDPSLAIWTQQHMNSQIDFSKLENAPAKSFNSRMLAINNKKILACNSCSSEMMVVDLINNKFLKTIFFEKDFVANSLACDSEKVVVAGQSGKVFLLSAQDLTVIKVWGGFGSKNGNFLLPADIALDSTRDQIFIVDEYNHRVQVFNSKGILTSIWGKRNNQLLFSYPKSIALDDLHVYISDKFGIHTLTHKGEPIDYWEWPKDVNFGTAKLVVSNRQLVILHK